MAARGALYKSLQSKYCQAWFREIKSRVARVFNVISTCPCSRPGQVKLLKTLVMRFEASLRKETCG